MKLSDSDLLSLALICFGMAGLVAGALLYVNRSDLGVTFLVLGPFVAGIGVGKYRGRPK